MADWTDTRIRTFRRKGVERRFLIQRYNGSNIHAASSVTPDFEAKARPKLTHLPDGWWARIVAGLISLFEYSPKAASTAVLSRINAAAGRSVYILPELVPGEALAAAVDGVAATTRGEMQYVKCRADIDLKDSSTWDRCKIDPTQPRGTGLGSDAILEFSPENYPAYAGPGSQADERLLHELVHAMRIMHGVQNDLPIRAVPNWSNVLVFRSIEEFLAILVTNVYHAENNRWGLRADHLAEGGRYRVLHYPLHDPETYYRTFKDEIDRLRSQKQMRELFT